MECSLDSSARPASLRECHHVTVEGARRFRLVEPAFGNKGVRVGEDGFIVVHQRR